MAHEVALERLLSTKVYDADGRHAGRVEEVHAKRRGGELLVTEYVLGSAGLIERLSLAAVLRALIGKRLYPEAERYTVSWDELDLTDPERPRLTCRVADLDARLRGRRRTARRSA
jgi:sporulation protein YlmC with PRC-barrel domain